MSVEEARALMTDALTGLDRDELLAERAEAEAQLRAAEATLGITPAAPNGDETLEQEPDEAAQNTLDVDTANGAGTFDVVELRRAATAARAADDILARAASEAAGRPPSGGGHLGTAESAFARALEIQEDLPAAWRRLVGALISATGMAIVVGALGWNTYWLLVPIALIAILTIDLRLSGKAVREASAEAARELATVGGDGTGVLERIRLQRTQQEEAESRLATARADRDAAYARFEELASGRRPSEVEEVIAEYEAEQAARAEAEAAAEAEAEAAAQAEAEPEAAKAEAEAAAEPAAEQPATASEWWFGSTEAPAPPPAAPAPVRALAERLSAEGREALARIEAQLAALDRVELAKKSIEWHEANGSAGPADGPPEKA
ncbi:MAG TPA: hypothetical protein VG034_22410 [Acidimicrobiia bacterium]|nr:hypothetical protein [Acidimicrobiia bacterium]